MSHAHKASSLALKGVSRPIDSNTRALFHFDNHAYDHTGTIRPLGIYPDIEEGLVAAYNFQSEQPIGYDISGNDRHGKFYNCSWGDGRNGRALVFNGSSSYAEFGEWHPGESFSISLWANVKRIKNGYWWCKHTSSGANIFLFGINSGGYWVRVQGEAQSFGSVTTGWQHLALAVTKINSSQSHILLYKNGEVIGDQIFSSVLGSNIAGKEWVMGQEWDDSTKTDFFDGLIEKLSVYNRALSPEEIQAHYNEGIYTIRKDGKYGGAIAVEKGTVNLISKPDFSSGWTITGTPDISDGVLMFTGRGTNTSGYAYQDLTLPSGTYTLSYWAKTVNAENVDNSVDGGPRVRFASIVNFVLPPNQDWAYFSHTLTTTGGRLEFSKHDMTNGGIFMIKEPQLELSSFPTSFVDGAREDGKLTYPGLVLNPSSFTFNAWIKLHDLGVNTNRFIFYVETPGATRPIEFLFRAERQDITVHWDGGGVAPSLGKGQISPEEWTMTTITFDSNKGFVLYFNGERVADDGRTPTLNINNTSLLHIANVNGAYPLNGLIDELRIDNIARTDEEIYAWYVSSAPHFPPDRIKAIG